MTCRIRTLILAILAIAVLVAGIYAINRPMAYGTSYYHASVYEGSDFSGSFTFYPDNTMVIQNTNFDEEMTSYYYYKDGYIFFSFAETEAEYEEEVAEINKDFEGAVNTPFYASAINVFKLTSVGLDGYKSVYLCQRTIFMAAAAGFAELVLITLSIVSFASSKKTKCNKK